MISFHVPELRHKMTKTKQRVSNAILVGTLLPPNLDQSAVSVPSMGLHDSVSEHVGKAKQGNKKDRSGNKKKKNSTKKKQKHNNAKKETKNAIKPANESEGVKIQIQPSRPRGGKNISTPRKGKKAISVRAWLRRGR